MPSKPFSVCKMISRPAGKWLATSVGKPIPRLTMEPSGISLAIRAAIRWEDEHFRMPWWLQMGEQIAMKQALIDPDFPENETPRWENLHLRGAVEVFPGLTLEAGVENLLDQEYSRHLTVPAATATGDLMPGDEIPEPGRYGYVTVNWIF